MGNKESKLDSGRFLGSGTIPDKCGALYMGDQRTIRSGKTWKKVRAWRAGLRREGRRGSEGVWLECAGAGVGRVYGVVCVRWCVGCG